jgi:lysophospholipase L1-like esterase
MAIFDFSEAPTAAPPVAHPPQVAKPSRQPHRFVLKAALAFVTMAACLAAWHFKINRNGGLDPAIFAEAFHLRWPAPPPPPVPVNIAKPGANLPPPSPILVDDSNSLDPFFTALWNLEQGKGSGIVTILHYGDSPTTADLITGDIRAQLQAKFGDAGRGYTLIAKPWAWYGHRGVEISDHGWKMRTGVGLIRQGIYGLGGAAFEGQPGAWSRLRLTDSQQTALDVEYLARPGGGSFEVDAAGQTDDDGKIAAQNTASDSQAVAFLHAELPAGTKAVVLRPTNGTVTLFGVDFRRGSTGLVYDSLGLNGATTSVLARVLDPALWKAELAHAGPALVIVNYGSNESSFGKFVHTQYANELRLGIQRIRAAAPGVPILIMSPMDRGERNGLDDIETMSTIPEIVAIQRQIAAEQHCAFFDTFDAMGASGTMARWYAASPRLVTADLLHPTPQGATIVAGLFVVQFELRYDRWKMQHGIALPPPPAPAATKTAEIKVGLRSSQSPHHKSKKGKGE